MNSASDADTRGRIRALGYGGGGPDSIRDQGGDKIAGRGSHRRPPCFARSCRPFLSPFQYLLSLVEMSLDSNDQN